MSLDAAERRQIERQMRLVRADRRESAVSGALTALLAAFCGHGAWGAWYDGATLWGLLFAVLGVANAHLCLWCALDVRTCGTFLRLSRRLLAEEEEE